MHPQGEEVHPVLYFLFHRHRSLQLSQNILNIYLSGHLYHHPLKEEPGYFLYQQAVE